MWRATPWARTIRPSLGLEQLELDLGRTLALELGLGLLILRCT